MSRPQYWCRHAFFSVYIFNFAELCKLAVVLNDFFTPKLLLRKVYLLHFFIIFIFLFSGILLHRNCRGLRFAFRLGVIDVFDRNGLRTRRFNGIHFIASRSNEVGFPLFS